MARRCSCASAPSAAITSLALMSVRYFDDYRNVKQGAGRAGSRLDQSPLCKREAAVVGHDEVIEHTDVDQLQRLAQAARDELIGMAGLGDSGGVVVREDDGGRVAGECLLHHLARMHAGAVDGAAKQFLESDQPVPVVQVQTAEQLVRHVT